jgi:hypothetical protein
MPTFVTVADDRIQIGDRLSVSLQRTLRVPDDGRRYALPLGLGRFPLRRVDDYSSALPAWREQGALFIPMYQREALWLGFDCPGWKPCAVRVGVGGINALSARPWDEPLCAEPQNYLVCPPQLWLDGVNAGHEYVRQFVAMPLGSGLTVEAQLTGAERTGGIQLQVHDPWPGRFPDEPPPPGPPGVMSLPHPGDAMGLGAGGRIRQQIFPDPHGIDAWNPAAIATLGIHILNSAQFERLTGEPPPASPIDASTYEQRGLPWIDLYDERLGDVAPRFEELRSIAEEQERQGMDPDRERSIDVPTHRIRKVGPPRPR